MTKDNEKPEPHANNTEEKFKFVFDTSTGKSKRVKLTEEELVTFEPIGPTPSLPEPVDKEALAQAIYECKTLDKLRDLLISDILPLL